MFQNNNEASNSDINSLNLCDDNDDIVHMNYSRNTCIAWNEFGQDNEMCVLMHLA